MNMLFFSNEGGQFGSRMTGREVNEEGRQHLTGYRGEWKDSESEENLFVGSVESFGRKSRLDSKTEANLGAKTCPARVQIWEV